MPHALDRLNDERVLTASDAPLAVVDRALVVRAVNPSYLAATGREREALLGVPLFEAFPDNPDDPAADGVARVGASFESVFRRNQRDRMAVQRYDIADPRMPERYLRRFWTPVNSPVHDDHGRVVGALHHVEDVTAAIDPLLGDDASSSGTPDERTWPELVATLEREIRAHVQTQVAARQLQRALTSRVVIEQAKGVVSAQRQVTMDEAFTALREWARSTNLRLHDVCADVIRSRQLPPPVVVASQDG